MQKVTLREGTTNFPGAAIVRGSGFPCDHFCRLAPWRSASLTHDGSLFQSYTGPYRSQMSSETCVRDCQSHVALCALREVRPSGCAEEVGGP